ncbi:hypothetical protein BKA70DRAFT_1541345 [Coprinopsis sp. MPI-PUGE-AT-0042]|nr:hypothetical protein BKA70DRAFT_1541345 [Coprinopsis sp. MPI-PUGE-AT-0042]
MYQLLPARLYARLLARCTPARLSTRLHASPLACTPHWHACTLLHSPARFTARLHASFDRLNTSQSIRNWIARSFGLPVTRDSVPTSLFIQSGNGFYFPYPGPLPPPQGLQLFACPQQGVYIPLQWPESANERALLPPANTTTPFHAQSFVPSTAPPGAISSALMPSSVQHQAYIRTEGGQYVQYHGPFPPTFPLTIYYQASDPAAASHPPLPGQQAHAGNLQHPQYGAPQATGGVHGQRIAGAAAVDHDPSRRLALDAPASAAQPTAIEKANDVSEKGQQAPQADAHDVPTNWDGWPDGHIELDLTWSEFEATKSLMVHWTTKGGSGDRKGKDTASFWEGGKKSTRQCCGYLSCRNGSCKVIVRAQTTAQGRAKQLGKKCRCGSDLDHFECKNVDRMYKWKGGVHYINDGFHNHPRPTHLLHLTANERIEWNEIVFKNPSARPLQLIVGLRTGSGHGKSVADISPVLTNRDRVGKELQQARRGQGPEASLKELEDFAAHHPGFVTHSRLDEVVVICLQTDWMRSQALAFDVGVETTCDVEDAVSADRWVPVLFLYTNGATSKHYKEHFLALMKTIAKRAEDDGVELDDNLFASVTDFSEAEHQGFIDAFTEFWRQRRDNNRSPVKLEEDAKALVKGCLQHFHEGVYHIKRSGGIIAPEDKQQWEAQALALATVKSTDRFLELGNALLADFPKVEPWLRWWLRREVAERIFASQRIMQPILWDALPDSTNAEEAIHWTLYSGAGRDHSFIDGLKALHAMAVYFERIFNHAERGGLIRYGQKPWKISQEILSESLKKINLRAKLRNRLKTTKQRRSRNPRYKNDGRPPDNAKSLLKRKKAKQVAVKSRGAQTKKGGVSAWCSQPKGGDPRLAVQQHSMSRPRVVPSYPWSGNSCWLDTSLDLIYHLVAINPAEYSMLATHLNEDSLISALANTIFARISLAQPHSSEAFKKAEASLRKSRDEFRIKLHSTGIAMHGKLTDFQPLLSWLWTSSVKDANSCLNYRPHGYFELLYVQVEQCPGSGMGTSGDSIHRRQHALITSTPWRTISPILPYSEQSLAKYENRVDLWFKATIATVPKNDWTPGIGCWRAHDGIPDCSGEPLETPYLAASIPVVLFICMDDLYQGDMDDSNLELGVPNQPEWNFPSKLFPGTRKEAKDFGLVYQIVGRVFYDGQHYKSRVAKYRSMRTGDTEGKLELEGLYQYDGMVDGGCATLVEGATLDNFISGDETEVGLPLGTRTAAVAYRLVGGLRAQELFFEKRRQELERLYSLQLSDDLVTLPHITYTSSKYRLIKPEELAWTLDGSFHAEYVADDSMICSPQKKSTSPSKQDKLPAAALPPKIDSKVPKMLSQQTNTSMLPAKRKKRSKSDSGSRISRQAKGAVEPRAKQQDASQGPQAERSGSPYPFLCRCGAEGDGHIVAEETQAGGTVMCESCERWSHIACQRDGRASKLNPKKRFVCDSCEPAFFLPTRIAKKTKVVQDRLRRQKRRGAPTAPSEPLERRLTIGKGALAKYGKYWYPVRLLDIVRLGPEVFYQVRWWRYCHFVDNLPPDQDLISIDDLVDELWLDQAGRRSIRLGRWARTCDLLTTEDILADPSLIPYTEEIGKALEGRRHELQYLLNLDLTSDAEVNPPNGSVIPAEEYARAMLSLPKKPNLPPVARELYFSGTLTVEDRAGVANWVERHVAGGDTLRRPHWFGKVTLAHAFTLLITYRLGELLDSPKAAQRHQLPLPAHLTHQSSHTEIVNAAWTLLRTPSEIDTPWKNVDVDRECLQNFEERLFERSWAAGRAGNQQWGLNAGTHQDRWNPYLRLPLSWNHEDQDYSDSELQTGPQFSDSEGDTLLQAVKPPNPKRTVKPRQLRPRGKGAVGGEKA